MQKNSLMQDNIADTVFWYADNRHVLSKMIVTCNLLNFTNFFSNVSVKPIAAYKIQFTEFYNDINIKHEKQWQLDGMFANAFP